MTSNLTIANTVTGTPGTTVTLPILIDDATGVVSLDLLLTYDTTLLSIIDPVLETDTNEGIKRAGISQNWVLLGQEQELTNPVANVNEETGEVNISLIKTDTEPNQESGTILEIDFEIAADAELGSTASIDLQASRGDSTSRIGIDNEDLVLTDSDLNDGAISIEELLLNTPINRFQNSDRPGTFLFAGEEESQSIRANFPNFVEEGEAFKVAVQPEDDLIRINRFQNSSLPGTFLFAGEEESQSIRANFPNFVEEGIAFYVYSGSADRGVDFYRFQNEDVPGTYIFVGEAERQSILSNFPNFIEEGVAFEVSI